MRKCPRCSQAGILAKSFFPLVSGANNQQLLLLSVSLGSKLEKLEMFKILKVKLQCFNKQKRADLLELQLGHLGIKRGDTSDLIWGLKGGTQLLES